MVSVGLMTMHTLDDFDVEFIFAADVDLFGAKPFTVPTPTTAVGGSDVFGMPVFSPLSPNTASDQEMIDIQVCLTQYAHYMCVKYW